MRAGSWRIVCPSATSSPALSLPVPAAISAALELRDNAKEDYMGKGVSKAVTNVNTIIGPALVGMSPAEQKAIDDKMVQELDGSKNDWGWSKSKLGANAILGVSMAVCKAGAASKGMPLYKHIAELADNPTDKMHMPVSTLCCTDRHPALLRRGHRTNIPHFARSARSDALRRDPTRCSPPGTAGPGLQRHQRRQPRRKQARHAGVHDSARRGVVLHGGTCRS